MTRSSRAERLPLLFSETSNSASSAASSSRSGSLIATLFLEAHEGGSAFGHAFFPRVGGGERRQPATLLLKRRGANCQLFRLLRRQRSSLGGDRRGNLLQTLLAHRLGEDCVCFTEGIDAVNEVDIKLAHIHREPADTIDESCVSSLRRAPRPAAE